MDELKRMLIDRGAGLVGFADMSDVDEEKRRGFPFAVSIALPLTPEIIAGITDGPTRAYCDEYDRANAALNELSRAGQAFLVARGHKAEPLAATMIGYDPVHLCAPFQHKTPATLSGLAWIGKCDLAVTERYGSAVRWCSILTDAPLPAGTPVDASRCGDCTSCVEVCPGDACSGKNWRPGMAREDLWNARACEQTMARINTGRDAHHDLCGMCIAACPYTLAYLKREGAL
ncbi:MAG TPA: epoxyqueuosine reductase [Phycisphaerae bacterium]|nr:epoxyqueuosine reductase [Phycisphaerae bacterium]